MSLGNLLNRAVTSQQTQQAGDFGRLPASFVGAGVGRGTCAVAEQQRAEVAVAEAVQGELTADHGREQLAVCGTGSRNCKCRRLQSPHPATVPFGRLADRADGIA